VTPATSDSSTGNSHPEPRSNGEDGYADNGYSMAYILAHIQKSEESQRAEQNSPRKELQDYLTAPLRSANTDPLKFWAVSSSCFYSICVRDLIILTEKQVRIPNPR
jgi:hypothetical protein